MKPLGIFGGEFDWNKCRPFVRDALEGIVGYLGEHEVQPVANYLDHGVVVDAWMEYTEDLIGGAFGVAGGAATMTDGVYVWRCDTSAYVREYRVALSLEFLEHGRNRNWQMPAFQSEDVSRFRTAGANEDG